MRRIAIAVALASTLVLPAAAQAGGWATVVLAPPPAGLQAEETWTAQSHGAPARRTPTDGAAPSITIRGQSGAQTFTAKPGGATGAYVAKVVFPQRGLVALRGERRARPRRATATRRRTRTPLSTSHPAPVAELAYPAWPFALAALALVAGAAVVLTRQRSRRPATQS